MTPFTVIVKSAVIISLLLIIVGAHPARATSFLFPELKEPTNDELLKAAGANPGDAKALMSTLSHLHRHNPGASDANLVSLKEAEEGLFGYELRARGATPSDIGQELMDKLAIEFEERRVRDPRRQIDAISRRLEQVGTVDELQQLFVLSMETRTHLGAWRFLATIQGILAREDPQKVAKTAYLPVDLLAPLLRDLPPEKAGTWALEYWKKTAVRNDANTWWEPPALKTRLWLAWSISEVDPQQAREIFAEGLKSHDAALRLFSGMGILRLTDADTAPFCFTASPEETSAARNKWLKELEVHKPVSFRFPDPLSLPVVIHRRGSRVDLHWFTADGSVARESVDVWPTVEHVLPDGTTYCRKFGAYPGYIVASASQEGRATMIFPGALGWSWRWPSETGGFWGSAQEGSSTNSAPAGEEAGEFAPTGELLWASPRRVSGVFGGGRGKVLFVMGGRTEIVNRRGDVLWAVTQGLDDPRWGGMIDDDTVLISCTSDLQIHHRKKGLLRRIVGFGSLAWVRYHPEKPWMIRCEGGIALYDPGSDRRIMIRTGWGNNDPYYWSKWLPNRDERWPE